MSRYFIYKYCIGISRQWKWQRAARSSVGLVLPVPVQEHGAYEVWVRTCIVADNGSASIHDHGYKARAEIKGHVHAEDRPHASVTSRTTEETQVSQLLISEEHDGRRLWQEHFLDERVRVQKTDDSDHVIAQVARRWLRRWLLGNLEFTRANLHHKCTSSVSQSRYLRAILPEFSITPCRNDFLKSVFSINVS